MMIMMMSRKEMCADECHRYAMVTKETICGLFFVLMIKKKVENGIKMRRS
jgi:hypothetical protein